MSAPTVTTHDVLAGRYRGGRMPLKATLTHASVDGGRTSLCGLTDKSLCDIGGETVTCPRCARKVAALSAQK